MDDVQILREPSGDTVVQSLDRELAIVVRHDEQGKNRQHGKGRHELLTETELERAAAEVRLTDMRRRCDTEKEHVHREHLDKVEEMPSNVQRVHAERKNSASLRLVFRIQDVVRLTSTIMLRP